MSVSEDTLGGDIGLPEFITWNELSDAENQFRHLAKHMMAQFPKVRRWEETDDVIQHLLMGLHKNLQSVQIKSPLHFQRLVALQIRRRLLDLARHYSRENGHAAHHESTDGAPIEQMAQSTPPCWDEWARFHHYADKLPDEIRDVFDLIWYGGKTQEEAAADLGVSTRQCQRRWRSARHWIAKHINSDGLLAD